jgi:hypothetical protein
MSDPAPLSDDRIERLIRWYLHKPPITQQSPTDEEIAGALAELKRLREENATLRDGIKVLRKIIAAITTTASEREALAAIRKYL